MPKHILKLPNIYYLKNKTMKTQKLIDNNNLIFPDLESVYTSDNALKKISLLLLKKATILNKILPIEEDFSNN